jgi:L-asparaginase
MKDFSGKTVLSVFAVLLLTLCFTGVAKAELPVVKFIATGGTIAMKIDPVKKAPVPAISGEDLVATVPKISKVARIEVLNLSNVPSDYMDPERWIGLQKAVTEALASRSCRCDSFSWNGHS